MVPSDVLCIIVDIFGFLWLKECECPAQLGWAEVSVHSVLMQLKSYLTWCCQSKYCWLAKAETSICSNVVCWEQYRNLVCCILLTNVAMMDEEFLFVCYAKYSIPGMLFIFVHRFKVFLSFQVRQAHQALLEVRLDHRGHRGPRAHAHPYPHRRWLLWCPQCLSSQSSHVHHDRTMEQMGGQFCYGQITFRFECLEAIYTTMMLV